jgi:hypothetical protein
LPTLAGAGACVLTIADASVPSLTATVAITVSGGPAVVTLAPTSVSFTSPAAAAQQVAISGGTAPYALTGCTGVAAGSIAQQVLTVAPQATGTCAFTLSDANGNLATLPVGVNAVAGGSPLDNLTFHGNAQCTGWYQNETTLTTANVRPGTFGKVALLAAPAGMPVLGKVYAQPLYVTTETAIDGQQHNLVIVAGSAGQIYAFDEASHAVV